MATLHLLEQGAVLRLRQGRARVEVDGHTLSELPARKLSQVVVHGNIRISTPALHFFLQQGVPVVYLSRQGQLYGLACACRSAPPALLRAQLAASEARKVALIRELNDLKKRLTQRLEPAYDSVRIYLVAPGVDVLGLGEASENPSFYVV